MTKVATRVVDAARLTGEERDSAIEKIQSGLSDFAKAILEQAEKFPAKAAAG